jgi:hypoxanthine phosphoribosyltransferase
MMANKEYMTWEQFDLFVKKTIAFFKDDKLSGVYGIPRGGLVPAVAISYNLGIPLLLAPIEGCLVIDDISDTGLTLQHYKDKGYKTATIYLHEQSVSVPDFYYYKKTDKWIVYPWDGDKE